MEVYLIQDDRDSFISVAVSKLAGYILHLIKWDLAVLATGQLMVSVHLLRSPDPSDRSRVHSTVKLYIHFCRTNLIKYNSQLYFPYENTG